MSEEILARQFEEHREHLRAVGFRMLGSTAEADDAVQETWLRLARVDSNEILNLAGWLTTALSRVCLDMLRSRGSRREVTLDEPGRPDPADAAIGPETEAVLADSIGVAMLVVLDTLTPAERLTFVLHDLFAVPFDEIAPIVDRSPAAARQLASRARRRVQGGGVAEPDAPRRRRVVEAFLAASREGRFEDLLELLDPDVVLRADSVAVSASAAGVAHGAPALSAMVAGAGGVAEAFSGRARAAQVVTVDGRPAAAWAPGGHVRAVYTFVVEGDRIVELVVLADPASLAELDIDLASSGV